MAVVFLRGLQRKWRHNCKAAQKIKAWRAAALRRYLRDLLDVYEHQGAVAPLCCANLSRSGKAESLQRASKGASPLGGCGGGGYSSHLSVIKIQESRLLNLEGSK